KPALQFRSESIGCAGQGRRGLVSSGPVWVAIIGAPVCNGRPVPVAVRFLTPTAGEQPIMSRGNLYWLLGIAAVSVFGLAVAYSAPTREKDRDYELVRLLVDVLHEVRHRYVMD